MTEIKQYISNKKFKLCLEGEFCTYKYDLRVYCRQEKYDSENQTVATKV